MTTHFSQKLGNKTHYYISTTFITFLIQKVEFILHLIQQCSILIHAAYSY